MATTKGSKAKKKRTYNSDPATKISQGEKWTIHFDIDPDVGRKILAEKDKTGSEYGKLINAAMRKGYRLPKVS